VTACQNGKTQWTSIKRQIYWEPIWTNVISVVVPTVQDSGKRIGNFKEFT